MERIIDMTEYEVFRKEIKALLHEIECKIEEFNTKWFSEPELKSPTPEEMDDPLLLLGFAGFK